MALASQNLEHYQEMMRLMGEIGQAAPKVMGTYNRLHQIVTADGALSYKVKELMALGIAITVRCDGCIAYHVDKALDAGANREEIVETIGVAIMMGGGPSVMYGAEAMAALEEISKYRAEQVDNQE